MFASALNGFDLCQRASSDGLKKPAVDDSNTSHVWKNTNADFWCVNQSSECTDRDRGCDIDVAGELLGIPAK